MHEAKRAGFPTARVLGVLVVLALVALAMWSITASRRWGAARAAVAARLAARMAQPAAARVNVFATADAGDAWELWLTAISAIDEAALEPFDDVLDGEAEATDLAGLDAAIASHAEQLRKLVAGARRATAVFPRSGHEQRVVVDNIFRTIYLGRLGVVAAERHADRGEWDSALEKLLASLQFGRDLMNRSPMIASASGAHIVTRATDVAARWVITDRLDEVACEQLAGALATIDDDWPELVGALVAEHEWMAVELGLTGDQQALGALPEFTPFRLWEHGFSMRMAVASWWDLALAREDVARRAAAENWATAEPLLRAVEARADTIFLRMLTFGIADFAGSFRETRARTRVLREALAARSNRGALGLIDPFTQRPLARRQTEVDVRVWSVGKDGLDSGGVGWLIEPHDGADLAIEIRR